MDDTPERRRRLRPIEVVVLVFLLVIVGGLFLVSSQRVRDYAYYRAQCQNNLKQICLAIHNYAETYKSKLPPLYSAPIIGGHACPQSFFFTLLPFIEQDSLYRIGMGQGPDGPFFDPKDKTVNLTWMCSTSSTSKTPIYSHAFVKTYVCPADPTNSTTKPTAVGWVGGSYGANYLLFGAKDWKPQYNIGNIPDGASNTVFIADRFAQFPGPAGQFTGPPGETQQANNLWAWPANWYTSPPTVFMTPVPENAAMFAYHNPWTRQGYGEIVFSLPQISIPPEQADYRFVQSGHTKVVQVGMGDGSARGIAADVSQRTWQKAVIPNDGTHGASDWSD
jgi:hypothetical protein